MEFNTKIKSAGSKSLVITGTIIALLGALATYGMSAVVTQAIRQSNWIVTTCQIDQSEYLPEKHGVESIAVKYNYEVAGKKITSTQYTLPTTVSYDELFYQDEVERLVPGTETQCYYDPNNITDATLEKATFASAAIILIPLLFLSIGLGLLWLNSFLKKEPGPAPGLFEHKTNVKDSASTGFAVKIFFSIFFIVGLGATCLFFGAPYLALKNAANWQSTECSILDSTVTTSTSRDKDGHTSTSYDLDVRYEYTINNKRYIGTTYNPAGDNFYKSDLLYKISDDLNNNKKVACFYNPLNPTESAITIELPRMIWAGLLPLVFSLVGIFGFTVMGKTTKKDIFIGSQKITKETPNRFKGIISYLLITAIWNGITGALVYAVCFNSDGKIIEYTPLLISIPFLLIGALLILGIPYVFLQLFNPTVSLELSDERPEYDSNFNIRWRINGNPARVKELIIEVSPDWGNLSNRTKEELDELIELNSNEAMPNRDLSLKQKFADLRSILNNDLIPAYRTTSKPEISNGQTDFKIPKKEALLLENSKLSPTAWQIKVTLKIPFYPDLYEIYQL